MTTAQEYAALSDSDKKKEDWMNNKWRPMMGWMYMSICFFDFMLAPVLWSLLQGLDHGQINSQWQPLTLQGAGLFHIAMGAVLGIAAYGRTQEKLNGANNGGIQLPANVGTTYQPPQSNSQPATNNLNTPAATGFNTGFSSPPPATGFGSGFSSGVVNTPAPTPVAPPAPATTSFGGRLGPVQPVQPVL
jgi:hypothetical protein